MNISKPIRLFCVFFIIVFLSASVRAEQSSRTEIFDNPFLAVGENPKNKRITGYLVALRTSPDRTDECKVFFSGWSGKNWSAELMLVDAIPKPLPEIVITETIAHGTLKRSANKNVIIFNKSEAPGHCDWILGFIGEPDVVDKGKQLEISINTEESGNWLGVNVIRSKRAYFHSKPDEANKGKAFVVAGDLIYIYGETPNWYYVKFQGGKKETTGWIKKADTIQFPE